MAGTALTGVQIKNNYLDVCQMGNTGGGLTGTLRAVSDGSGANSGLWLSTTGTLIGIGGTDATFTRLAAGVIGVTSWLQATGGRGRNTANVTNATAAMANLADLTVTLLAGRKYLGCLVLFANNSTAAEGLAFDFNGGTATMTSFEAGFAATPPGAGLALGVLTATALGTALTATTATTADAVYVIEFACVVNAGGTLIPRFAEVSHTTGTATVKLGSNLFIEDSPN